ncbi:MAG: adenine-specific methyltransferase EcoRI family protein [Treponema sp.]|nr:adenine-specific methyltransferase EcoRI family protein [Treponema sp.]
MGNNAALRKADRIKEDEFYTQLPDIEKELSHYKEYFKGKTILCNCDDPRISNFFRYFALNFNEFGLKKIISTCYKNQDVDLFSQNDCEKAVYIEYTGNPNDPTSTDFSTMEVKNLKGDGDFRSNECIELLKQADIVVTNPPFSLFREYVTQLIDYSKKFIIIGNQNAISYKEIFKLFKENKLWLGYKSGDMSFRVPADSEPRSTRFWIDENGNKWRSMGNVCWYTNLDTTKRHEDLVLYKTYSSEEYPKFDNYDAINVNKTSDIPMDYYGLMGVPITFFDKYNPDQFDVIDGIGRYSILNNEETKKAGKYLSMVNGKAIYFRIIIKRKK